MKFLDLFAGIGGFRLGMEAAGHKCVGFCEIDKFARESYKAIHDTEGEKELHDITSVSDDTVRGIGTVDVICGGFPCQAFSVAGKRAGFEDTRGTLFFEIARFASILRPKYLFLENVTGLLSHDNGNTFETIIRTLDELGYDAEWEVFNSKNFGVPQNRERVFIIGHLRGECTRAILPFGNKSKTVGFKSSINVIGSTQNEDSTSFGQRDIVYGINGIVDALTANDYKGPKQVCIPVLTPERIKKRQNGRRFKRDGDYMFTLTAQDRHGVVVQVGNIIETDRFGGNPQAGRVYDPVGISHCLNTMQGGGLEPKIIVKEATAKGYAGADVGDSVNLSHPNFKTRRGHVGKKMANTLLTGEKQGVVVKGIYTNASKNFQHPPLNNISRTLKSNNHDAGIIIGGEVPRVRKLTPRECWRLQGFPDWAFEKAAKVNSNSQLYKQAGNSVTVNVIKAIAKRL